MPRMTNPARNRVAIQATQDRALHLRNTTNLTLREIARECGYINPVTGEPRPSTATEAIRAARLRATNRTPLETANTAVAMVSGQDIPSNRTFGFEAEFFGITQRDAVEALATVGITARIAGRTERGNFWKITTDSSVTSTGTGIGIGLELVSPILRGTDGLEMAAKAVKAIFNAGGKIDTSCGLHIHVGMDNLTGADMIKIVDLYSANQRNIYKLVANSRHNGRYSKDLTAYTMNSVAMQNFRNARTASQTATVKPATSRIDRFTSVNVAAYSVHGTLEFRQHQGTLNGKKLTNWIKFILALVEQATVGNTTEAFNDLDGLLGSMTLLDTATLEFLKSRATSLAN